ncbi:hypothetical protein EZV62_016164 [Acer yangbiense]|uniref:CCHC-type domain-containing protein n=1 Tax=Acer yangbiense TaxID=1000413 RepID=A0A5C7HNL5_9ROSI|nr:hypothetical protein EZV62_016164 [Acer yangbiense]
MLCGALSTKEKEGHVGTLDERLKSKGEHRLALCLVGKVMATKLVNKEAFIDVMQSIWRVNEGVEIEAVEGNVFAFHFRNMEDQKRIQTGGPCAKDPLMRSLRVDLLGEGQIKTLLLRYERLMDYCFKCGHLGHSLRECVKFGEEKKIISEAQMRLNVWLRTPDPEISKIETDDSWDGHESKFGGKLKLGSGMVVEGKLQSLDELTVLGNIRSNSITTEIKPLDEQLEPKRGTTTVSEEGQLEDEAAEMVTSDMVSSKIRDPAKSELIGRFPLVVFKWNPPYHSCFKINCKAMIDDGKGLIGFGIVIRNASSLVMASYALRIAAGVDIWVANALAILISIQFGSECGLAPFESFQRQLDSLRVQQVAPSLSKMALRMKDDCFWIEDFSLCVRKDVEAEYHR